MGTNFETEPLELVYTGTVTDYHTFEIDAGVQEKSVMVHSNQAWGYHIEWTMKGPLVLFLAEEFRLTVYLEDMSPADKDVQLPPGGPLKVPTLSGALNLAVPSRSYKADINVPAHAVPNGVYKPTILIQVYDTGNGQPWPVAAFDELPLINIYPVTTVTPRREAVSFAQNWPCRCCNSASEASS